MYKNIIVIIISLVISISCNNSTSSEAVVSTTYIVSNIIVYENTECNGETTIHEGECRTANYDHGSYSYECLYQKNEADCNEISSCEYLSYYYLLRGFSITLNSNATAIDKHRAYCSNIYNDYNEYICTLAELRWYEALSLPGTWTETENVLTVIIDGHHTYNLIRSGNNLIYQYLMDIDNDDINDICREEVLIPL